MSNIQFCFIYSWCELVWCLTMPKKKHQYQKFSKFSALFYYKWSEIQTTLMSTDDLVLNQSRCKDFFAAYEGGPQNFLQTDITNRCFYWFTCICNLNWKINWTRILASSKSTSILLIVLIIRSFSSSLFWIFQTKFNKILDC